MTNRGNRSYIAMVDIIKAVSCLMIFLYHCNTILPGEWKLVTIFGQRLGNNLFFMVSGFTLATSIDAAIWKDFPRWYLNRLVRILPITLIAYILAYLAGYYSLKDPDQLKAVFIYPTLYWFITCILIFYIVLFAIAKIIGVKIQITACIVLAAAYVLLTGRQEALYIIGLLSMLVGYITRKTLDGEPKHLTNGPAAIMLVAALVVFTISEAASMRFGDSYMLSLSLCVSSQTIGISAITLGYTSNEKLTETLSGNAILQGFVGYVGDMALPLYIVQSFCSGYIGFWIGLHINFPLSFPIYSAISWGFGTILYFISKGCVTLYRNRKL